MGPPTIINAIFLLIASRVTARSFSPRQQDTLTSGFAPVSASHLTLTAPSAFLLCPPPILLADYAVEERPSEMALMQQLEEGGPDPLVFVLNANLLAMVKLVNCESPPFTLF